jgi:hypothetical protein
VVFAGEHEEHVFGFVFRRVFFLQLLGGKSVRVKVDQRWPFTICRRLVARLKRPTAGIVFAWECFLPWRLRVMGSFASEEHLAVFFISLLSSANRLSQFKR